MANVIDAPLELGGIRTVLCDLDGVVWLAHVAIADAAAAVARIRESGRRVLFVTNNSAARIAEHEAALAAIGIPAAGEVLSSAQAAATLVRPREHVLICGGPGVVEAVEAVGATPVRDGLADVVVVGFHRDFDYERLRVATTAVRAGARFIGTNDDATYPTPTGPIPGGGALVAAVAVASGTAPMFAGKPYAAMAELVRQRLGGEALDAASLLMVGDRPSTDGAFAVRLGCPFALVRSGVTPPGALVETPVHLDVADLAAVADALAAADPTDQILSQG